MLDHIGGFQVKTGSGKATSPRVKQPLRQVPPLPGVSGIPYSDVRLVKPRVNVLHRIIR